MHYKSRRSLVSSASSPQCLLVELCETGVAVDLREVSGLLHNCNGHGVCRETDPSL